MKELVIATSNLRRKHTYKVYEHTEGLDMSDDKKKVTLTTDEYERAEFLKLLIEETKSPAELKRLRMELKQIYHQGHMRAVREQI